MSGLSALASYDISDDEEAGKIVDSDEEHLKKEKEDDEVMDEEDGDVQSDRDDQDAKDSIKDVEDLLIIHNDSDLDEEDHEGTEADDSITDLGSALKIQAKRRSKRKSSENATELAKKLRSVSVDEVEIPPEPEGRCSAELQEKISRLMERKVKHGADMNKTIQKRKDFRNPSIYEKLILYLGIEEFGTNFPSEDYNPKSWRKAPAYDELARAQREDMAKKEKEKKTKVEFLTGTAKIPSTSNPSGGSGSHEKKTKWDQQASKKVPDKSSGILSVSQSSVSAKTTVISAIGTIKKSNSVMLMSKICPRCVLRYLNSYQNDLMRKSEDEIRKELGSRWPNLTKIIFSSDEEQENGGKEKLDEDDKIKSCQSCLGMLQDEFLMEWTDAVLKAISDESYIFKTFKLMISQPVQLLLFDRAVLNEHETLLQEHQGRGKRLEVKDIVKIFMEPKLEKSLQATAVVNDSELEITLIYKHKLTENELLPKIEETYPRCFAKAKHQLSVQTRKRPRNDLTIFTTAAITEALAAMGEKGLDELLDDKYYHRGGVTVDDIKMMHAPIYLAGRYNKYSRKLPQTPWILNGERIAEMSVQEYITELIMQSFHSDSCNFSSSGREDVDVRMLGTGRPFIIELKNPRNHLSLVENIRKIEKQINEGTKKISIRDLQVIQKEDIKLLKEGEEEKTKTYSALCCVRIPHEKLVIENGDHMKTINEIKQKIIGLSNMKDHVIDQNTPLRVLHRRNLAIRNRIIHSMSSEIAENCKETIEDLDLNFSFSFDNLLLFKLSMTTQAGTYVKEFVHGDFGRTTPYLGSIIGAETDIISLDVAAVNIDWPPQVNE